ncbi:FAD-binding oxidoreductase [Rhodoblastus sp.]|uniref:FAD-binding oxidoreductase n=1 Tax=Rhodoblastus sp. TaxID=1962975 RepID=UPI003F954A38
MISFQPCSELLSWGRILRAPCNLAHPRFRDDLPGLVEEQRENSLLAVGLGRSYGDSGLNCGGNVIAMRGLDRVTAFDADAGVIRADAGLSLDQLIRICVPHGLFPPVAPGTRFVTLGGMVANDVHGKNHHRAGTFGSHVRWLRLRRTDGSIHDLCPDDKSGLFAATIGGLGLTGVIEQVEIQLKKAGAYLESENIAFDNLADFFQLALEFSANHEYTVAWVDCANSKGRGVFSCANQASNPRRTLHGKKGVRFPVEAPSFALNSMTLKAFNALYFNALRMTAHRQIVHYAPFFFPLDAILNWNRLYGRRGMYQYQCALPTEHAQDAVAEMLVQIAKSGLGSFLAVLKTFGDKPSPGLLSFPLPGATLALDFQNHGDVTLALMKRLDTIVAEARGRLYPAKDGRIGSELFASGYPELSTFAAHVDPGMSSTFWRRVHP